jgi:DNA-binding response OmpR family regulator
MHDPRKPRALKPRTLSVMVLDTNNFSRNLINDILRGLMVTNVLAARTADAARFCLSDNPIDVILVSWEETDSLDGLGFVRELRRSSDDRVRRLPVVLVTSGLTRQMVIDGRDAGVDEFLAKPIAPVALNQRLGMVVETPRPFVDSAVYLGPCRRRKNPADYHGDKRRRDERAAAPLIDADELEAKTPIRVALAGLRGACAQLRARDPQTLIHACLHLKTSKDLASAAKDTALLSALAAFEAYISIAVPLGQMDENVTSIGLSALEQLATLPQGYTAARDSVAMALGKAIQKKLAA